MRTILITGKGFVSSHLDQILKDKFQIRYLTTSHSKVSKNTLYWNPKKKELPLNALENVSIIIHLAGANIADKAWTKSRKQLILESRVLSGQLILEKLKQNKKKIELFLSASATGYYGAVTNEKLYMETSEPHHDFLSQTCEKWEDVAQAFLEHNIAERVVKIRTGIVFAKNGGALKPIILPTKFFMMPILGSGKQIIPWIHIDDLCHIYSQAITDTAMTGAYNAVAPHTLSYTNMMQIIRQCIGRPLFKFTISNKLLKLILGERAVILTEGSAVSCQKIKDTGFKFNYPTLDLILT